MAKSLKTNGLEELHSLLRRVGRQRNLMRISRADADYIVKRLNEVEARITQMHEKGEAGTEEFDGS